MDITLICTALTELPLLALLKLGETVILPADFKSSAVAGTSIWQNRWKQNVTAEIYFEHKKVAVNTLQKTEGYGKKLCCIFLNT